MIGTTFGDRARHHMLTQNTQRLKNDMTRLTQEMATGQTSDPARKLSGNTVPLANLDRVLGQVDARLSAISLVTLRLDGQQAAMQGVQARVQDVADTLLRPELFANDDRLSPIAKQVGQVFSDVVGLLNTQAGGRSLFAGQGVDRPALSDPQIILDTLAALIPSGADRPMIDQIVGDWFAPGGGFDTIGYLGADAENTPIDLGDGLSLQMGLTAAAPEIRGTLAALAKAALMDGGLTTITADTRRQVLSAAAIDTRSSSANLRDVIEQIGISQARVDEATTRQQTAKVAASMAKNLLIAVDPYETATALQDSIARVDQMFAITARLSRLSLSAYL